MGSIICLKLEPNQSHLAGKISFEIKGISRTMQISGLNHVILTDSNTERSRAFYGDLLGFPVTVMEEDSDKSFFFPSHQPTPNDRFSEFRIGLDLSLIHCAEYGVRTRSGK